MTEIQIERNDDAVLSMGQREYCLVRQMSFAPFRDMDSVVPSLTQSFGRTERHVHIQQKSHAQTWTTSSRTNRAA